MKINIEIETEEETFLCQGCAFQDLNDSNVVCNEVLHILGIECPKGRIFKKKINLETCTKENTKVGDTIYDGNKFKRKVAFIFDDNKKSHDFYWDFVVDYGSLQFLRCFEGFKVEVKKNEMY